MALLWTEGWDLNTGFPGQAYPGWDAINVQVSTAITYARNGTGGINMNFSGASAGKLFPATQSWIVGAAIKLTTQPGSPGVCFFSWADGATTQCGMGIDTSGRVIVFRSTFSTNLATSALVVPNIFNSTWHYVQVKVTIASAPLGFMEVLIDGVQYVSVSGVNTQATANAYATWFYLQNGGGNSGAFYVDDIYVCDTTGNQNNNYLGDVTIVGQLPVANGTTNNFQRGGSTINAQNWQQVSESPYDSDTTYVFDSNVGDEEGYTYGALSQTGATIYSIGYKPVIRKDDTGVRSVQLAHLSQGVEVYGAVNPLSLTYATYYLSQPLDPATGQPWTIAGANGCEQRIKIAA